MKFGTRQGRKLSLIKRRPYYARGGGVLPYMGYIGRCRCEGYGFQAFYSGMRYINQRVRVIFQETDQLIEDFSLTSGNRKLKLKLKLKLFWLDCASDVRTFWKTATIG